MNARRNYGQFYMRRPLAGLPWCALHSFHEEICFFFWDFCGSECRLVSSLLFANVQTFFYLLNESVASGMRSVSANISLCAYATHSARANEPNTSFRALIEQRNPFYYCLAGSIERMQPNRLLFRSS